MKKFFIALEENNEAVILPEENTESLEVEIHDIGHDVQADLSEVNRASDVIAAMEDLYEIVQRIDKPQPVDIALIQSVANMAVAGTDIPASSIFPATENFSDLSVTLEGIGDKIINAIKAVGNSIANIIKKIGSFAKAIIFFFRSRIGKIKNLKIRLQKLKNVKKVDSISLSIHENDGFRYGESNALVTSIKDYQTKLTETETFTSDVFDVISTHFANSFGNQFKVLASLKSVEEYNQNYKRMFLDLVELTESIEKIKHFKKTETGNFTIFNSDKLLAFYTVEVRAPSKSSYDLEDFKSIKRVASSFSFGISNEENPINTDITKTIDFEKIGISDIENILNIAEKSTVECIKFLETIQRTTLAGDVLNNSMNRLGFGASIAYTVAREILQYIFASFKLLNTSSEIVNRTAHEIKHSADFVIEPAIKLCFKAINNTQWTAA